MILIADGGSTKTNWCLLVKNGERVFVDTEGYNPYFVTTDYIKRSLDQGFQQYDKEEVKEVHFYGSGCFPEAAKIVSDAISQVFPRAAVSIQLDLVAAARALLGSSPGFAAILGTGTNTCLYDGEKISLNIDSLGYILGDEGSGTAMGKKLLADFIRGAMPVDVESLFKQHFRLDKEQIFKRVYSDPLANRFCAGFSPFIYQYIHVPYLANLVRSCFTVFFDNLVSRYPDHHTYSFNCIGSVGYIFAAPLKEAASASGMQTGVIARSPLEGLIAYHTNHSNQT